LLACGLSLFSCRFDSDLKPGAKVRCQDNGDCPRGSRCVAFGVCAEPDGIFVTKSIVPEIVGPGRPVRIVLEFGSGRDSDPNVWAVTPETQELATLKKKTSTRFEYEWSVSSKPDGDQVVFIADSVSTGQRVVELGTVAIDRTPPVLQVTSHQLTPPSVNLLGARVRELRDVANQAELEVVLRSNEVLAADPQVWIIKGTERVSMQKVPSSGAFGTAYRGNVGEVSNGSKIAVWAMGEDLQGNQAPSLVLELNADTEPPTEPKVDEREAIVFFRAPFGTLDVPKKPLFEIEGKPGALPPSSVVIVSSSNGIVAQLDTKEDGSLPRTALLLEDDLTTVFVQAADLAGNLSKRVRVRDVDLRTYVEGVQARLFPTFDGMPSTLGQFASNPSRPSPVRNVVEATPFIVPQLELVRAWPLRPYVFKSIFAFPNEGCVSGQNSRASVNWWADGFYGEGAVTCILERGSWWWRAFRNNGLNLVGSRRVDFGPTTSLVVGSFGSGVEDAPEAQAETTYESFGPSLARRHASAALDFPRDQAVIFGGEALDGGVLGDTWLVTYRGKPIRWVETGSTPPPRKNAAMAYHPGIGRLVLHGGNDGVRTLDDTWTWNGSLWERMAQSQPLAREQHELMFGALRGTLVMSGGVRNGAASESMAVMVGAEWVNNRLVDLALPATCTPDVFARAVVTNRGVSAYCPVPNSPTQYALYDLNGGQGVAAPLVPFAGSAPNFNRNIRLDITRRFGLAAFSSDDANGPGLWVINNGAWVRATTASGKLFAGACFVWNGEFACTNGRTVLFSNDAEVDLPPTSQVVLGAHVWPQSEGIFVADRTLDNGKTSRFIVTSQRGVAEWPGDFYPVGSVVFAGAPEGELFVMLRTANGLDLIFTEVFDGAKWVSRDLGVREDSFAMTQAVRTGSGRLFAFDKGGLFGPDPTKMAAQSPMRYEVRAKALRPSLLAILPDISDTCDELKVAEVEGDVEGEAGGVQGVEIQFFNGFWYQPTPVITSRADATRPKASFSQPGAAFRFGTALTGLVDVFERQPLSVRFVTVGQTKGALDGRLTVKALMSRYACRLDAPKVP
jgi:hypothetical protein